MIQTDNVFPRVLVHVSDEFQIRTNGTQFEIVHVRENPPALAQEFKYTAISLGRFGTLDALSRSLLTKTVLYYGQSSYEARSVHDLVTAIHGLTSAIVVAVGGVPPDMPQMPVLPEPAAPSPQPKPTKAEKPTFDIPKVNVVPPSKRADAVAQAADEKRQRDPMRGKKDAPKATGTATPVKGKPARFK